MKLIISDFDVKKIDGHGDHIYLSGIANTSKGSQELEVFFLNRLEETKVFKNAELSLSGEWVETENCNQLLNTTVIHVRLITDINLDSLSIKERLNASGLIHEFREVYKKDKYRALEILKVLGVNERFAEEMLIKNTFMLPFI